MAENKNNKGRAEAELRHRKGLGAWAKERWRKFLVALKRRPQMIPLTVFVVAFLFYSLNLMYISDTTARIQGNGMGLAGFVTMLFSMLSFVCFLNAFPYRKKPNVPMMVLMYAMVGIVCAADLYYNNAIWAAITRAENPIKVTEQTSYIAFAEYYLRIHVIILVVGVVLTLLLPVYSKWLRKIKTSVDVGDNGNMGAIDISGEA
ncbi:MAG: hypothetical protein HDT27_00180 [Subdoligranulum sp.]|nr:hypothetical protein [Subdoligranulum sp.]MBD5101119.1 hypothetical protein [Subdoligranulum sp.]